MQVEETSNTSEWYESTAMARRPPILATVDRYKQYFSAQDGLLVSMAPVSQLGCTDEESLSSLRLFSLLWESLRKSP